MAMHVKQIISFVQNKYSLLPVQAKASLWFLICSFLQKGISMITVPIFTRLLTTSEYGQFNVFNSWMGIISIFITLNLSAGVYQQGLIKYDKERNIFSSSLQGMTLVMVLAWTVVYLAAHDFWNSLFSLTTIQMLAMMVMIWTSAVFSFWATEQRVLYMYRTLVAVTLGVSILQPALGVILVILADDKVTARILGIAFVQIMAYTGFFFLQMKQGKQFYSKKFWKYVLSFNLPLVPHYLSQVVLNNSDRIMISYMTGPGEAGIYSLAYSLSMIMILFNIALMDTMGPWIYQKIKDKKIKDIAPAAYMSIGIIMAVNLLLIMLAPEAVRIFAPPSYYEAIYCIPPIAMSVLFIYAYDLFAKFAFYYEQTRLIMFASVGGAILNIILNYFGIQLFGYVAAAYTTLICYILYDVFHYTLMTRICRDYLDGVRPYNTKLLIAMAAAFMLCGFAMLLTYDHPIIRYSVIALVVAGMIIKRKAVIGVGQKVIALRKKR